MAIATIGAVACGEYSEGVAVMLFYQIGELFQSYAVGKSRSSITALMDIRPESANLEDAEGNVSVVDPDDVEIGSIIVVKPGEKIPLDGKVVSGESTLNTAALTGESRPRTVRPGDDVISGCVNEEGILRIETTTLYDDSTVAKNPRSGGKFQPEEVSHRELHHQVCPLLHPGRLHRRAGAGLCAAAVPGQLAGLDHARPDLPGHQLPLRAGHLHPPHLLRRHRRRV